MKEGGIVSGIRFRLTDWQPLMIGKTPISKVTVRNFQGSNLVKSKFENRPTGNFYLSIHLYILYIYIYDIINIDGWQWILLTHNSYSDYASTVHMIYLKIWTSSLNYIFSKYARAINSTSSAFKKAWRGKNIGKNDNVHRKIFGWILWKKIDFREDDSNF